MKRILLSCLLASIVVGCSGACGGGESESAASEAATTGSDTTPTTSEAPPPTLVVGTDACASDADCIPGGCCHPTTCVARSSAPVCGESVCTTDCRYGTLDCGGSCLCHEGHCAAQLSQGPNIPGVTDVQ